MDNDYIGKKARELEPELIKNRRDFHKYPETGFGEFRTSAIAKKKMEELGYKITWGKDAAEKSEMMGLPSEEELNIYAERAISEGTDRKTAEAMKGGFTGFWADMIFSDEKPCLALRCDMDANDITECKSENHRPAKEGFSSVHKGIMHACGHDAHTSIALGAAEIIAGMKDKLKGKIRFIFQPAEEGLRGAAPMIRAGALNNVDYIVGSHIGFQAERKGVLICGADGFLASTKLNVKFTGKAAHAGAKPEEGNNALLACCCAALNLHAINRHSGGKTRINVGKIRAGEARNIIPSEAFMIMETRGETTELNKYMENEARRIIKASSEMYCCNYEISKAGCGEGGKSSPEMISIVKDAAENIKYFTNIIGKTDFGAGEDFAGMMSEVQKNGGAGTYIQIGTDRKAGHHNNRFDFDESVLSPAAELIAKIIYKILKK